MYTQIHTELPYCITLISYCTGQLPERIPDFQTLCMTAAVWNCNKRSDSFSYHKHIGIVRPSLAAPCSETFGLTLIRQRWRLFSKYWEVSFPSIVVYLGIWTHQCQLEFRTFRSHHYVPRNSIDLQDRVCSFAEWGMSVRVMSPMILLLFFFWFC